MNDRDEIDSGDDPEIVNALSKLRGIEPPAASRIRNRAAVGEALRAIADEKPEPVRPAPWWRRSVAVPLPVAASLLLACVLLGAAALRNSDARDSDVQKVEQIRTQIEPDDSPDPDARPTLTYRASATYICGIGQIQSSQGYFFKENNR